MKYSEFLKSVDLAFPQKRCPYIIAEAGVNHEGDMDTARRLVNEACEGGADAIKFQTYKAETIASKDSPAYWDLNQEPTDSQYKLFKKHDKFWKGEFEQLAKECDRAGIEFMSTPFDVESAEFLNDMMEVFKISSSDLTNRPFIEHICRYDKPIILSVGASSHSEIFEATEWVNAFGNPLALLQCILNYPTDDENANIGAILDLRRRHPDRIIGYSDHTLPKDMRSCEIAWLLGAQVIEKHFSHDKSLHGNDHYHAMDLADLKQFKQALDRDKVLLGSFDKVPLDSEQPARNNARRSLVASRDIPKGTTITMDDLTWKRPAHGISPRSYQDLLGRKAAREIAADTVLQWEMFSTAS